MSEIWLGTIAQPYEPATFWVAGNDKETVKQALSDELETEWGEEPPFNWSEGFEGYEYYEGYSTAEVREIIWLD